VTTTLFTLLWVLPLVAAGVIAVLAFGGWSSGERDERLTSRVALGACVGSVLCTIALAAQRTGGQIPAEAVRFVWFNSGDLAVPVSFMTDWLSVGLAAFFAAACLAIGRFAVHYMHREPGFHRFFMVLSLFTSGVLLLVTAGNALLTFAGWEITGLCSYLLIAFFAERRNAAVNATRVFVTNRIGDACFILGTLLAFVWLGSTEWEAITGASARLEMPWTSGLAACFAVAAMAKSAQVPFSPWLTRAMEGPTPSSALFYGAVLVHAGIYLLLRLQPLLAGAPVVATALVVVGAATALYGFLCGLAQTDMKSALAFSAMGQLGLMVAECGMGWTTLAALHLVGHASWRGYQFLTAPSILAQMHGRRTRPVPAWLTSVGWLYTAALQRGWLEDLGRRTLVAPTERFAADLARFDVAVVDRVAGLPVPAVRALSSLAGWEERRIGPTRILDASGDEFASGRGLVGSLTATAARLSDWFEDRLIVKTLSLGVARGAHALGGMLTRLEDQLERPAVVLASIFISLLALLGWMSE
jgi:NADH:ubiquinone oxidoreductase subunit 5 (subunit L)/multisubunit Na+/H+ antiporter MnhA subunit